MEVVGADVLFSSGADDHWSVLEEDMLLDAVEHHGFGSWLVSNRPCFISRLILLYDISSCKLLICSGS